MGEIIPFVARVRDSGDWTAAERARLEGLADHFAEAGVHVEVVYGVTDDGDPWCVVKDEHEEILLHVARIGGAFVVHYAAEDSVAEAPDLPAALGERLMGLEADEDDHVVVPFAAGGRSAQMLIALVVATAFFYDTREARAEEAPALPEPPEPDAAHAATAALPVEAAAPQKDRELALHGAAAGDASETPKAPATAPIEPPAPAPEPAAAPAVADAAPPPAPEPQAEAAPVHAAAAAPEEGQVLTGTSGAEVIHGGAGDDTLSGGGAPEGQFDILDGGAGNDRIVVTAQVIAIGGAGADTFVIEAPKVLGDAHQLLGVILDFRAEEGDRMVRHDGHGVTFVTGPDGVFERVATPPLPPGVAATEMTTRFVDLNGDGRPDGFLMVGHGTAPHEPPKDELPPSQAHEEPPPPAMLPGETFAHHLFG